MAKTATKGTTIHLTFRQAKVLRELLRGEDAVEAAGALVAYLERVLDRVLTRGPAAVVRSRPAAGSSRSYGRPR